MLRALLFAASALLAPLAASGQAPCYPGVAPTADKPHVPQPRDMP